MFIGIKDGKIWDMTSLLCNKRDDSIPDDEYLYLENRGYLPEDTWDFEKNVSLRDSPFRFQKRPKTELELLKEEIQQLKDEISKLKKRR